MGKLDDAPRTYTFDDFILQPRYSNIKSRKAPDISVNLPALSLKTAIISSPMNTITEEDMIVAMAEEGATSVLHRFMTLEQQLQISNRCLALGIDNFWVAVGATKDYLERAQKLRKIGVRNICVDVANGHSSICIEAVEQIKSKVPDIKVFAGNVCSTDGAVYLAEAGADVIRVGIGGGSMCKTRLVTGHGLPQLSAIEKCAEIRERYPDVAIVADGGLRNSGDIVKALAIGADAVMLGSLLAGTDESPGKVIEKAFHSYESQSITKRKYKKYAGMASSDGRKFNGWFAEEDAAFVPEGEAVEVEVKGKVKNVIQNLIGGVKTGMSYAGANNIKELQEMALWRRITNAGYTEGTPHGKR